MKTFRIVGENMVDNATGDLIPLAPGNWDLEREYREDEFEVRWEDGIGVCSKEEYAYPSQSESEDELCMCVISLVDKCYADEDPVSEIIKQMKSRFTITRK